VLAASVAAQPAVVGRLDGEDDAQPLPLGHLRDDDNVLGPMLRFLKYFLRKTGVLTRNIARFAKNDV
jgi:hypothetical protein